VHQIFTRRIRRVGGPVLLGVIACTLVGPAGAAAAAPPPVPTLKEPVKVIPGLVMHPVQHVLPVESYDLTARFGAVSGLWSTSHTGLDFAAPTGAPIRAVSDGVVTQVGYDGAYGNKTVLRLPDGTELWFCHQTATAVGVGEKVAAGDVIGTVGATGNVTGPHLHLEVRRGGEPVDPEIALRDWGLRP
jgi:murein DD-endopeptidase MepM/ murein hydrolase activator NlpD